MINRFPIGGCELANRKVYSTLVTIAIATYHRSPVGWRRRGAGAGAGAVTGRARRLRSASDARGTRRAPCTRARVNSGTALVAPRVRPAQRLLQLLHQPAVELVLRRRLLGASRALGAVESHAQRGPRRRRAAVRHRAHGRRRAMRAQRPARRRRRPLRPRLRHLSHATAGARLVLSLGTASRVVNVPVVLHHGHHERHLGGGGGGSSV